MTAQDPAAVPAVGEYGLAHIFDVLADVLGDIRESATLGKYRVPPV